MSRKAALKKVLWDSDPPDYPEDGLVKDCSGAPTKKVKVIGYPEPYWTPQYLLLLYNNLDYCKSHYDMDMFDLVERAQPSSRLLFTLKVTIIRKGSCLCLSGESCIKVD